MKCSDCNGTRDDCQKCFLAEQARRKSIEVKYIQTIVLIDKFYAAATSIMNPEKKRSSTKYEGKENHII